MVISLSKLETHAFFKITKNSPRPSVTRCNSKVKSVKQHPAKAGPEGALQCHCCPESTWPSSQPSQGSPTVPPSHDGTNRPAHWWLQVASPAAYSMSCTFCKNRLYGSNLSLQLWLIYVWVYETGPMSIGYPLSPRQAPWIGLYSTRPYSLLTAVKHFPGARLCK